MRLRKGSGKLEDTLMKKGATRPKKKELDEQLALGAVLRDIDPYADVDGYRRVADMCDDTSFFILFLLYPGCSSALFSFFSCTKFDGLGEDGSSFLRSDLSVDCDSAQWCAFSEAMARPLDSTLELCSSPQVGPVSQVCFPSIRALHDWPLSDRHAGHLLWIALQEP
jgi:hypothetical protein